MTILYAAEPDEADYWIQAIRTMAPDVEIRVWPQVRDERQIDFVIVGGSTPAELRRFPNLRGIQSTWAGVNRLLENPAIPSEVPLARMVDVGLSRGMTEFIVFHVLDTLRRGPELRAAQMRQQWLEMEPVSPPSLKIGILGLGVLGSDAAQKLAGLGMRVCGWSRSAKAVTGVTSFSGQSELDVFLEGCQALINVLPLTEETQGILSKRIFDRLAAGAVLIHVGRGPQLVEVDLLSALAGHQLARAVIDVFSTEPLPEGHPFWHHPQITVSPHVAAISRPGIGADTILENYRRARAGEPLLNQVDRSKGY